NAIDKFCRDNGLPPPSLWVSSGYGLHLYWTLEDPIAPNVWKPYAEALKRALQAHGVLCDLNVTADSARILRLPGTLNHKDPANPQRVKVLRATDHIANERVFAPLKPFMTADAATNNYGSNTLGGVPPYLAGLSNESLTAGQAGIEARDSSFEK